MIPGMLTRPRTPRPRPNIPAWFYRRKFELVSQHVRAGFSAPDFVFLEANFVWKISKGDVTYVTYIATYFSTNELLAVGICRRIVCHCVSVAGVFVLKGCVVRAILCGLC